MTRRASVLIAAAAATALATASIPAQAAMPVATQQAGHSDLTLVQDQTGGQKKSKKSKRQQEVDKSVESGTVPKRYRSSVPKEYHHLIPFSK